MNTSMELANSFYKKYYMQIFNDVFYVLIDKLHTNGFEYQMKILRVLIQVLDHVNFIYLASNKTERWRGRQQEVRSFERIQTDGPGFPQFVQ